MSEIFNRMVQKNHIQEKIEMIKNDIKFYREFNKLKPDDINRFSEYCTVEHAIKYSENELMQLKIELFKILQNP